MKKYSSATVWIFAILLLFLSATFLWNNGSMSDEIAYSEFQQKWINDKIDNITVQQDKMVISGKLRDGKQFVTYAPSDMLKLLMTQNPKDNIKI